jgi:hypothetical protein
MFHGLRYVRQAIAAIAGCTGKTARPSERAALEEAFSRLRPAMMFEGTWPREVQAAADRIHAAFFRHGPPAETVWRMTDREVRAMLALLRAFGDEAERIAAEEWASNTTFRMEPRGRVAAEAGSR